MPGFFFALLLLPLLASANLRTISDSGQPLYWASPAISLRGNPSNASGLTSAEVDSLLGGAFTSWNISGTRASLSYAQSSSYPAGSGFDGSNTVYFASAGGRSLDYGVVAITEVLYYVNSGQIAEADMVFNDQRFRFTKVEGDTGKVAMGKTLIYLPDVATHEAGHVLGLDHSIVNLASLIYTAFSGQFSLSEDDKNGIRAAYPNGGSSGAAYGYVRGRNGGVFGAHVVAINLASGKVQAGALAGQSGEFSFSRLPAGQYAFLMEPYGADITSVSSYFRNVNHSFCGSKTYQRRFYGACGTNSAAVVSVSDGVASSLGTLSPSCAAMGNPSGAPTSIASALDFPVNGGARFGTLSPGGVHYYRLNGASGAASAKVLAYGIYSPVDLQVEIVNADGSALAGASSVANIQNPMPGGLIHYDSSATAALSGGNYLLKVSAAANRLYSNVFAAGFDLLDTNGNYMLSLSMDGQFGASAAEDMSACTNLNNTVQRASTRAPASLDDDSDGGGGCGTLDSSSTPPWNGSVFQLLTAIALLHIALRFMRPLVRTRR
jgi:hypothetical protein